MRFDPGLNEVIKLAFDASHLLDNYKNLMQRWKEHCYVMPDRENLNVTLLRSLVWDTQKKGLIAHLWEWTVVVLPCLGHTEKED